jgi:hypothetical protein
VDNIRTDLREIRLEGVYRIHLVQDRDQGWAVVNTVLILRALQEEGNSLTGCVTISFTSRTQFHGVN